MSSEKKPHRVLLRVTHIDKESDDETVGVIIPSWDPRQTVRLPISRIPKALRGKLSVGTRLFGRVNIGAQKPEDLYVLSIELAPLP